MSFPNHDCSCSGSCCLKLKHVSVTIGTDCILKDVNLHVHCGQMVALIGPFPEEYHQACHRRCRR